MADLPITMHPLSYQEEKPSDGEILSTLVSCFDAEPEEVISWLCDFKPQEAYREYLQDLGIAR